MDFDTSALAQFYEAPKGLVSNRLIAQRLREIWPNMTGRRMLGVGYAAPYLRIFLDEAERAIASFPATLGPAIWAHKGTNRATCAEETQLPFADASFDCVLLVHALEHAESQRRLMRELWRVLAQDGKLLIIAPNRASLWSQLEKTPYGHGRPYSRGQLNDLLAQSLFRTERWDGALFLPPFGARANLRSGVRWDKIGRALWPRLAGVHIVEASKDMYASVPLGTPARARNILAPLKPIMEPNSRSR